MAESIPTGNKLQFYLILATLGRTHELERFLVSLQKQSYSWFRLIIVDQNEDQRVSTLINELQFSFPIEHLRAAPGLSHARNVGLQIVTGDVAVFPDDDCWYSENLLAQVADLLLAHPNWDGVTGTAASGMSNPSRWKWDSQPGVLTKKNIWLRAISISIFIRRKVIKKVGLFDESLGLGASTPWQSGEETDYLLRALAAGFFIQYIPKLCVYHPDKLPSYSGEDIQKAYFYGAGMGYVLHKHAYSLYAVCLQVIRPALNAFRYIILGEWARAQYYWAVARGRLKGWLTQHLDF